MKTSIALILAAAAMFACALVLVSCEGGGDGEELTFDQLVDRGKRYLSANNGALAAESFSAAWDMREGDPQAGFGLMAGHTTQFINLVDSVSGLAGSFLFSVPPSDGGVERGVVRQAATFPVGDYLQQFFGATVEADFDENEAAYTALAPQPDFDFELSSWPILFGGTRYADFGGEFDKTDLHILGALTAFMNAVIDIVQGHDLNFDVFALVIPTLDFTNDPVGSLSAIADLLDSLLSDPDYPDFLVVKGDAGLERMKDAGVAIGDGFERLSMALEQMGTETDDQSDDQLRYGDQAHNGRYDPNVDPVMIGKMVTLDARLAPVLQPLFADLAAAFWEGSPRDVHPDAPDTLNLAMFNGLLMYLGVLRNPILPDWLGVDIGSFFSNPTDDGLRSVAEALIELIHALNDYLGQTDSAAFTRMPAMPPA